MFAGRWLIFLQQFVAELPRQGGDWYESKAERTQGHTDGEEEHNRKSDEKSGGRGESGSRHRPRYCRASDSRGGRSGRGRGAAADRAGVAGRGKIGRGGGSNVPTGSAVPGETCEAGQDREARGDRPENEEDGRPAGEKEKRAPAFATLAHLNLRCAPAFARMP